jgi:hypothetical protein
MALAGTELELRSWLDRLAILDVIYRYCDAVTRADWAQCEALYVPDAIWDQPKVGLRFDSRAALMEMLKATSTFDLLLLTPHAPVINLIAPDRAQATTTIHEWFRGPSPVDNTDSPASDVVVQGRKGDEVNMEVYGVYYDDFARIDGEWKFTHRLYSHIYIATGAVTGEVLTPRSDLLRPS